MPTYTPGTVPSQYPTITLVNPDGSAWEGGGGGAVDSVDGQTGAVDLSGDYAEVSDKIHAAPAGDDTAGLAAALAASVASGDPLSLRGASAGSFRTTAILVPTGPGMIRGAGIGRTIIKWADGAGSMPGSNAQGLGSGLVKLVDINGFDIRDLTLDCNPAGNSGSNTNSVYILGGSTLTVERVHCKGSGGAIGEYGNGIRVSSGTAAAERVRVIQSEFSGHDSTGAMQFSGGPKRCAIVDNDVYGGCKNGIDWSTGDYNTCSHNRIRELLDVGGSNTGISFTNGSRMVVMGNVIQDARNGIQGSGGSVSIAENFIEGKDTSGGTGIRITGTVAGQFRSLGSNYIVTYAVGIAFDGVVYSSIVGGVINNCPVGLDFANAAAGNYTEGVVIRLATTTGARLAAASSGNKGKVMLVDGSVAVSDAGTGNTVAAA